jgi:cellulose synthase operon protein C
MADDDRSKDVDAEEPGKKPGAHEPTVRERGKWLDKLIERLDDDPEPADGSEAGSEPPTDPPSTTDGVEVEFSVGADSDPEPDISDVSEIAEIEPEDFLEVATPPQPPPSPPADHVAPPPPPAAARPPSPPDTAAETVPAVPETDLALEEPAIAVLSPEPEPPPPDDVQIELEEPAAAETLEAIAMEDPAAPIPIVPSEALTPRLDLRELEAQAQGHGVTEEKPAEPAPAEPPVADEPASVASGEEPAIEVALAEPEPVVEAEPAAAPEPAAGRAPAAEPPAAPVATAVLEDEVDEGPLVVPLDEALAWATEDHPERIEAALSQELAAEEDRPRKAMIQHELGHLIHSRLKSEARAVKAYAQALNLDPLLRPNVWAIRRIFVARQLWPNLIKLHDAEVRFEEDPARKAEILLEKGWMLQDRLDDQVAARECYWEAHRTHRAWLAPLLALEKLALAQGDMATLAEVYGATVETADDPARKVAALVDLARLQDKLADGSPQKAMQLLEEADAVGVGRRAVLRQMEEIATADGMTAELPRILRRQADELLRGEAPDRPAAAAKLRAAAHIARDLLADLSLAQELLASALETLPGEPLLQRDLLALAEARGDHALAEKILAARLEHAAEPVARAALHFRIGLARLAAGSAEAGGEALQAALQAVPGYLPAMVEQERRMLAAGDSKGLVQLWIAEAEAVEQRSAGLPLAEAADPAWCAAARWRAATLCRWQLGQPDGAIELCQRAIAVAPTFTPALEELEELLEQTGRHAELGALLEQQLTLADPDRAVFLLESLAALCGGPLDDPEREATFIRRLREQRPDDRRLCHRHAQILERLDRSEELEAVLKDLERVELEESQQVECKLRRARLYEGPLRRIDDALTTYREVLDLSPGNAYAFTALEQLLRREGKHEALAALLRLAADQSPGDSEGQARKCQVLRQLIAVFSRPLGQPGRALEVCAELLALLPGDRATLRDMARAAAAAGDAARLAEAWDTLASTTTDPEAQSRQLIRLAEVLEDQLNDPQRAEEMMARAVTAAMDKSSVVDAVEFLVRRQIARGDYAEALGGLGQLQSLAPAESAALLLEERAWLTGINDRTDPGDLWTQAMQLDPHNRRALFARGRLAARQRDAAASAAVMVQLADASADATLSTQCLLRAGVLRDAAGEETAVDLYHRVVQQAPDNLEALLGLLAQGVTPEERADIVARLTAVAPDRAREDLRLPAAEVYERAGRFREALAELAPLLEKDTDHVPALVVLQRIAEAAPDRRLEAHVLVRLGTLATDRGAKADFFGRAAELLLEASQPREAGTLLRHVLSLRPTDKQAFDRLRRLCEAAQDYRGLDDVIGVRIRATEESGTLIALHFERAELRLTQTSDRIGAVRDLLRILALDGKHLEALRKLAHLYDEDNNYGRALELYRQYVEAADGLSLKRPAVLRMAEVLERQGRTAEAVDVLRRFLELSTDDQTVLERLAELYIKVRDIPHAVSTLERLGDLRDDRGWKARNLQRVAALYWKDLKDLPEARATLLRARDLDPTNLEVLRDLRQLLKQMSLDDDLSLLLERAKDDIRDALSTTPLSVDLYRRLMQVAEWDEDEYTLLATMGVLCYLNAADIQDRDLYRRRVAKVTFEPKHQLGAQAWREALVESGAKNAYGEIWAVIAECVPRLFEGRVAGDPAVFGASRSDRVDRKAGGPVSNTLDRIAGAFGLTDFDIYQCTAKPHIVAGVAGDRSALVVGHSLLTSLDAARRFQVGRTLSLLRDRAFALEVLSENELELLFSAAIFTAEPGASFALPRNQVEGESRRLLKVLSRKGRRALPLAVARFMQEGGDLHAWIDGVLATASRAGLLVCGDIISAMDQAVPEWGSSTVREAKTTDEVADVVAKLPHAAQLLVYSIGGSYLSLRKELAL